MRKRHELKKAVATKLPGSPVKVAPAIQPASGPERLLRDLQDHQAELEMQNRELRETHHLLELSRDRYADLYDFAPIGYATLDAKGLIQEINLTAAGMLGVKRERLIGLPFSLCVVKNDQPAFREHLRKLAHPGACAAIELCLAVKGGGTMHVELQSVPVLDVARKTRLYRSVLTDITARKRVEEALRNNEARLRAILDGAVEGIVTLDECGVIESFNPAAERIFGYKAEETVGRNISLLLPSPAREKHDSHLDNSRAAGVGIGTRREVLGRRKDASTIAIELSVSEVRLSGRRLFTGIVRDITEHKRDQEALRRSEANLASAQNVAHVGSYEFGLAGTDRVHWSAETFHILGLDPGRGELSRDAYLTRMVHPDDQARVREKVKEIFAKRSGNEAEYRIVRPDGSLRHVHSIAEPVLGPDKKVIKIVGSMQDITERKELEKEILAISEREQSRIGRDLHDGLCQHLAGIEFRLLGLKQRFGSKSGKHAAETTELAKLVRQAIEQTRTLAHGLSPIITVADGLISALQELATSTEQAFQISCSFNCPTPVLLHDNAVATHLYRIAQEAIQNAIRHGKAKFITINLLEQDDRIVLGVKDDGVGFPKNPPKHHGMGLRVMQYRAGMVGGSLVVQHEPGGGTAVVCSLREPEDGQEMARPRGKLTSGTEATV